MSASLSASAPDDAHEPFGPTPYDEVPYPASAFPQTHPANSEVMAALRGLAAPPAEACRVLELGCGSGGNLIPLADAYPGSTFVGLDLSGHAIAEGQRTVAALGLSNIALRQRDILAAEEHLGTFDYIIAHGVYSWVPPAVREAMLAIFRRNLAPNGVAYVSYNCQPRSHVRNIARDLMLYHTRDMTDPAEKIAQARAIVRFIAEATDEREIYGFTLRDLASAVEERPNEVLFHDDLNPNATPFLFHEVMEAAGRHGVQFLCEAASPARLQGHLEPANAFLDRIPDEAIVVREQYLDFLLGRGFRATLLCHAEVPLRRRFGPDAVRAFLVASDMLPEDGPVDLQAGGVVSFSVGPDRTLSTDHLLSNAALVHLGEVWPRAVSFDDLVAAALDRLGPATQAVKDRMADEVEALAAVLHQAFAGGRLSLRRTPPPLACAPGERPAVSLLARRQAEAGGKVINRLHRSVGLTDPMVRRLVQLLDGTRDRNTLVADLRAQAHALAADGAEPPTVTHAVVERTLQSLARLGLLIA
jgi:SAM-dependent methyltransferase